jgi:hypothetical protein
MVLGPPHAGFVAPFHPSLPCVTFGIRGGLETFPKAVTFACEHDLQGFTMSLVVKLEDDLGERSEWVILNGVVPGSTDANFVLLSGIDPFGKTVFNHLQMEAFLQEWERAKERVRDDTQMEAWERVKHMAEACRHDRDLYLRFVGN